jgi:hypothetical protein
MRQRKNGWQAQSANNGKPPDIVWEPAEFELLLERLQINEADVVEHGAARAWIKTHYMRRFVPEKVLAALGLEFSLD